MKNRFRLGGRFIMDCYDKHGNHKWHNETENLVVDEGLNHALDVLFHNVSAFATWYIGLFEDDHAVAAGDDYAVPGFTESVAYDEGTRPEYVEAAAGSESITNSANRAVFTMDATKTIYGAFLCSFATKDDQAQGGAVMFCAAQFTNAKAVNDDDTLEVTYTIGSADDGV
jgi:hypothetical protein